MSANTSRLKPGELQNKIVEFLYHQERTGPHGVTVVQHGVGASSRGAVGQALSRLIDQGLVECVRDHPSRQYAITADGQRAVATGGAAAPAAAPVGAPAAGAAVGPVVRPNGQPYHPRALADHRDVDALRVLRRAGIAVLLYGPPGTGKTALVEAAFDDLVTVAGDGDITVGDLVGEYTQTADGRYEFVYGPLVQAMVEGRCLFLDDVTLISPAVLAVAYPAMDGRRQISVTAHRGEVITAEPGFYVIAGHNPGVAGAVLTEALASRFGVHIHVRTDYDLAEALRVPQRAVTVARDLAARQHHGEVGWVPQLRELLAFQRLSEVLGEYTAAGNLLGQAPEEDRDVVAEVVQDVYGPVPPLALGQQL